MISYLQKEKLLITLIILGLFFSFMKINSDLFNYDKYFTYDDGTNYHGIIRSPPEMNIWQKAAEIKDKLKINNIDVLLESYEFRHHFLPPKILGIFGKFTNMKFYNDESNKIYSSGNKLSFFIFQTLIYYLSVVFLYIKLKKIKIHKPVCLLCISFLIFEPTINQFNSTIYGETIFFSLIILIFSLLIDLPKKNLFYLFYGVLIGVCYLQRSVAIFLIIVPLIYIFLKFKKDSKIKIINLLLGFFIILLILGTLNYNRSKIFYVLPTQTIDNLYNYFIFKILKNKNLSTSQINNELREEKIKIINELDLDMDKEIDRITFYKTERKIAYKYILDNKLRTILEVTKSSLHSMLLNPTEIRNVRIKGRNYYKSDLHKKWIKYRITYSILIYFIIIFGIFHSIKQRIFIPNLFCFIGLSIFLVSSWAGYTRYFVPTYLCFSLYFSYGIYFLFGVTKKKLKYK